MDAIYNEIEPFAADWLERLAERGHIAPGRVERRSIVELRPADVAGPGQRHFFAGIGGWSYALRLAGVPDDADIWTGSCPCQPFSDAGEGLGVLDSRHLWPAWFALIEQCRPPVILGEQVASRAGLAWLDLVRTDLERCGYAFGASDLCAAGVGAPHIRQRLYFVAYSVGHPEPGAPRRGREGLFEGDQRGRRAFEALSGSPLGEWNRCDWIECRDGTSRPVEPGAFPVAYGVPARVGRVCGYGNAIVPQVAAAFIESALGAIEALTPHPRTEEIEDERDER